MSSLKRLWRTVVWLTVPLLVLLATRPALVHGVQSLALARLASLQELSNQGLRDPRLPGDHQLWSLRGSQRIWPHRVNSLQRFQYLYDQFPGFECDIRYNMESGALQVAHDSTEINSLVFEDYLAADPLEKLFWLDLKNLNDKNRMAFLEKLRALEPAHHLRHRLILESPDTTSLILLQQSGYLTSYYLPGPGPDGTLPATTVQAVTRFLADHPMAASEDFLAHGVWMAAMPGQRHLVWDIRFWHSVQPETLRMRCTDSSLLLCLINIKSPGYR